MKLKLTYILLVIISVTLFGCSSVDNAIQKSNHPIRDNRDPGYGGNPNKKPTD